MKSFNSFSKQVLWGSIFCCLFVLTSCIEQGARKLLEVAVTEGNSSCPMEIEEGMTMTKMFLEGENVIYLYEITQEEGEDLYAEFFAGETFQETKESILSELKTGDKDVQAFVTLCVKSGVGIIYKYSEPATGRQLDIPISTEELKGLKK